MGDDLYMKVKEDDMQAAAPTMLLDSNVPVDEQGETVMVTHPFLAHL